MLSDQIFKKAIIRSVPSWAVPEWIDDYVKDVGRPNLNPFVYDEFQDVQYFHCTDFHQDKTRRESDFVTVYLYLDQVLLILYKHLQVYHSLMLLNKCKLVFYQYLKMNLDYN